MAARPNDHGATGNSPARTPSSRRPNRAGGAPASPGAGDAPAPAVSGTGRTTASASAIARPCARYGSTSGAGANSAITPETTGPRPKPAESASVARRAPAPLGDSSCSQTLPGLMIDPIARP